MSYQLLIVEDEALVREGLALILEDDGYQVFQASTGRDALEIFKSNNICLLITDVFMPGMGGIALLAEARKINPDFKVIIISGGERNIISKDGVNFFHLDGELVQIDCALEKPFDPEEIVVAVRRLLPG